MKKIISTNDLNQISMLNNQHKSNSKDKYESKGANHKNIIPIIMWKNIM